MRKRLHSCLLGIIAALFLAGATPQAARAECIADFDRNDTVTIDDIFSFLNAWFATDPAADADRNGEVTIDDIFAYLNLWFAGCLPELKISPEAGGLGTVVTVRVAYDDGNAFAFDAATTMSWTGQFVPLSGQPSVPFQVTFSAADVLETANPKQAHVVLGTGATNVSLLAVVSDQPGVLQGVLIATCTAGPIGGSVALSPDTGGVAWHRVEYPDGVGGLAGATLGPMVAELVAYPLSLSPDVASPTPDELLSAAADFHLCIALSVPWTSEGGNAAPTSRSVSLVSTRADGSEVARISGVALVRAPLTVNQPITYSSDTSVPILLVDSLAPSPAPAYVRILSVETGGRILLIPE